MEKILSNQKRAKNIILVFKIMLILTVISIISNYFEYNLLNSGDIDMDSANANVQRQGLIIIIQFGILISSFVLFIMWFRRAYHNLHNLGINTLSFTEGWAAGCWFVPFINLVRPYKIMKEIWVETNNQITDNNLTKETSLIGWWWGLFLISNFIANISFRFSLNAESIDELVTVSVINILSDLIEIPVILITIKLIQETNKSEIKMYNIIKNSENTTDNSTYIQ